MYVKAMIRFLLVWIVVTFLYGCSQADVVLSAPAGEFHRDDLGTISDSVSISANINLIGLDRDSNWPPAAYAGFYQGESLDNSVQFVLIQNNSDDDFLVAGYRIIVDGEESKVVGLEKVDIDSSVKVQMNYVDSETTISINSKTPITEQTTLGSVQPYISVSSGTATFEKVDINIE